MALLSVYSACLAGGHAFGRNIGSLTPAFNNSGTSNSSLIRCPVAWLQDGNLWASLNSAKGAKGSLNGKAALINLLTTQLEDKVFPNFEFSSTSTAKVVVIVGEGSPSPLGNATWEEVVLHMAKRVKWIDEGFELLVFTDHSLLPDEDSKKLHAVAQEANFVVVINVKNKNSIDWLMTNVSRIPTMLTFDSAPELVTRIHGVALSSLDFFNKAKAALPGTRLAKDLKVLDTVTEAWNRYSSDDIYFIFLILIDSFATPVKLLKNLRATELSSLVCMTKNCGKQILACLLDPNCRKALNCLANCSPTDQVCNYRCIVSHESPLFESFSLCILHKHNCLGLTAEIQMKPNVQPMLSFRGMALNHELAEDLFVGWLGKLDWSWRVVAGQNAAYDQFPCQFQLFYRGKAKGSMWYDPVFQVKTLEDEMVWRRRHYRVKRGATPGTFYFSVLDNGVVSKEFWRIVDVVDDLSWGLFYYSGAAASAGLSYTGAILVSPDGLWPAEDQQERITCALEKCGIKRWELYSVDNCNCKDMPLGIPDGSTLQLQLLS